jgi:hypothetical protein
LLRELQAGDRPATVDEQQVLARWSGWGAVPGVFDERSERFADARGELKSLLDEREWRAASKTTLSAYYTDAAIAQTMWDVVTEAGFGGDREPVRVLEPGCGAGTFIGLAPAAVTTKGSALFGVELDPTTAAIAKHLYPHADIRQESFADTRIRAPTSTWSSATCRSAKSNSTIPSTTRATIRCTTTSSSSRSP